MRAEQLPRNAETVFDADSVRVLAANGRKHKVRKGPAHTGVRDWVKTGVDDNNSEHGGHAIPNRPGEDAGVYEQDLDEYQRVQPNAGRKTAVEVHVRVR